MDSGAVDKGNLNLLKAKKENCLACSINISKRETEEEDKVETCVGSGGHNLPVTSQGWRVMSGRPDWPPPTDDDSCEHADPRESTPTPAEAADTAAACW